MSAPHTRHLQDSYERSRSPATLYDAIDASATTLLYLAILLSRLISMWYLSHWFFVSVAPSSFHSSLKLISVAQVACSVTLRLFSAFFFVSAVTCLSLTYLLARSIRSFLNYYNDEHPGQYTLVATG